MAALDTAFVTTHLGKMQVRHGGDGQHLVYLHSATGEGEGMEFLTELADNVEVFAPMFPGFGDSEGIDRIDDIEDAAFHLLDVFDCLHLERPTVVGLSLGGWLALEVATRWPERVGRLVLINPVGLYIEGAEIKDIFGRSPGEMADDLFADQHHPIAQMMHAMDAMRNDMAITSEIPFDMVKPLYQTMAATARLGWDPYLHDPKLRGRLWRITAPTLVVRGEKDGLVPAAHAEAYAAEIPNARLEVVPNTAHLVPLEDPGELTNMVLSHIEGNPVEP